MNKFKVTNRSLLWELTNSIWIIFSFIGLVCVSFFIIGSKARQKKWTRWGFIYAAAFIFVFISFSIPNQLIANIGGTVFFVSYFGGILHCFAVRNKYLVCRDIIVNANLDTKAKKDFRDQMLKEYEDQGIISSSDRRRSEMMDSLKKQASHITKEAKNEKTTVEKHETVKEETKAAANNNAVIDINDCSTEDLTSLPGITVIKAKKAETYRNEHNGFSSLDEFYKVIELQPHFMMQLEGKLTCSPLKKASSSDSKERKGRVLDF